MTQHLLRTLMLFLLFFQVVYGQESNEFVSLNGTAFPPGTLQKKFGVHAVKNGTPILLSEQLWNNGKWNASMLTQAFPLKKEISVTFEVMGSTNKSGELFEVYLVKLMTDDCNGKRIMLPSGHSSQENIIIEIKKFNYTEETVWTFTNVAAGRYCIKVYPVDCYRIRILKKGSYCTVLNSAIVTMNDVAELVSPVKDRDPELRNWQEHITPLVIVVAVLLMLSSCNYVLFRCLKARFPSRRAHQNIEARRAEIVEMVTMEPLVEEKVKPFILFCPDKDTRNKVLAVNQILLEAADINVNMSRPHLLAIYGAGAVQSTQHNKIIVVETDSAIKLQQKREEKWSASSAKSTMIKLEDSCDEIGIDNESAEFDQKDIDVSTIPEENHFVHELTFLTSEPMRSLKDYCHIFVIKFKDSMPTKGKLKNLVPNERYILPDQMLQFCLDLLDGRAETSTIKKNLKSAMDRHWKFDL